jgi:hypothetical protein
MEPQTEPQTRREVLIEKLLLMSSVEIMTPHGKTMDIDISMLFRAFQTWLAREGGTRDSANSKHPHERKDK